MTNIPFDKRKYWDLFLKRFLKAILLFMLCSNGIAFSLILRMYSLEWLVDSCPVIVSATGFLPTGKAVASKNNWKVLEILKSDHNQIDIFQASFDFFGYGQKSWSLTDRHFLFFRRNASGSLGLFRSINSSKPDFPYSFAISKNREVLSTYDQILKIIRDRVKIGRNFPQNLDSYENRFSSCLGMIVLPISKLLNASISEATMYLLVPADEDLREFVKSNAMKTPLSSFWIKQLVNYPDSEVIGFLKKCLNDCEQRSFHYDSRRENMYYFPNRQAAFDALKMLGVTECKPDGYNEMVPESFY